jgi:hypothetical protein
VSGLGDRSVNLDLWQRKCPQYDLLRPLAKTVIQKGGSWNKTCRWCWVTTRWATVLYRVGPGELPGAPGTPQGLSGNTLQLTSDRAEDDFKALGNCHKPLPHQPQKSAPPVMAQPKCTCRLLLPYFSFSKTVDRIGRTMDFIARFNFHVLSVKNKTKKCSCCSWRIPASTEPVVDTVGYFSTQASV